MKKKNLILLVLAISIVSCSVGGALAALSDHDEFIAESTSAIEDTEIDQWVGGDYWRKIREIGRFVDLELTMPFERGGQQYLAYCYTRLNVDTGYRIDFNKVTNVTMRKK